MYIALMVLAFIPTIYTTVRIYFIGQLPSEYAYSIAGQLSWVNLIFEITQEAIILPLFYFIGEAIDKTKELINRIKTGLLVSFVVYTVLAVIIILFIHPLLNWMSVSSDIKAESATYIRIEVIANIFSTLVSFITVVLITINKEKYIYIFTVMKLILCLFVDLFLVSNLACSLNLGVNGIGYSNIIVNAILLVASLWIINYEGYSIWNKEKMSFGWMKSFVKKGFVSGFESFVRNYAYMAMICKMVNVVNEQGTYWVANNFIWGWLLIPITQLGELIKKECGTKKDSVRRLSLGYFAITLIVCLLWLLTIPLWKPFMIHVLDYSDNVDTLYKLVLILIGFYILYAIQNVFDSTFYGLGKIWYMFFESVITNSIYYGIAYILYKAKVWTPSLYGIALLFGCGNAFDSVVSYLAYVFLLKREKINIFDVNANEDKI
ncbi:putative Na+-driven multidrug efflux pump [Piromyces finnis]|uniref:Putative Na+-driven multidrug efflux pump n=1 Tax=Piromyces finnis TaxID=1754191 RepID=A0A1Y1VCF5_9FUNG|nr:putative Na+-driven multidrug efflux pump [Piromyces finnis]|eukprot:ORX52556.1 putative Na+-driven multidrug efflux pump [Piromyces finnis]